LYSDPFLPEAEEAEGFLPVEAFSRARSTLEVQGGCFFFLRPQAFAPYNRCNTSRNLRRDDGAALINERSRSQYPVFRRDHVQKNQRVPELKRHVTTRDHWIDPDEWACCGIAMDRAYLYGKATKKAMTGEEYVKAGAYMFWRQSMVGVVGRRLLGGTL
jgi:hypothetical protein